MSETLLSPALVDSIQIPASAEVQTSQREEVLRDLFDPPIIIDVDGSKRHYGYSNYEVARDTGLLDMFDYRPEIGRDPVLHILKGELKYNHRDEPIPEGFHHEPSARHPETVVNRKHIEDGDHHHRKKYHEKPFEPYQARISIEGFRKHKEVEKDGETESVPVSNVMFPKEYDALAVLHAIRQAKESRDESKDKPGRDGAILATGYATMLDGKTRMSIRMVLDGQTGKIITANPFAPKERGYMNLSAPETQEHLGLAADLDLPKHLGSLSVKSLAE